ncbi:MAG: DUF502 domain-containing protein [Phycisphaerae bacterium]|nr:DUF502 domain-containing protein [Phycisphaerae bacterium]
MAESNDRTPRFGVKRAFLRGLAVLLPSILTLWILVAAYQFISRNIAEPINAAARSALAWGSASTGPLSGRFEPSAEAIDATIADRAIGSRTPPSREAIAAELRSREVHRWWNDRWYTSLFGLVVALTFVYVAGRLVGGWLGRKLFSLMERVLISVPLVGQIYPHVKQIVGFFFSDGGEEEKSMKFSKVVVVEYPRKGIWSIGLLTGTAMLAVENEAGDALTVFIPSSPPLTGWTVTVPRDQVHELPITIDEALRYLVSGGVLVPPHQEGPPRDPLPPARSRISSGDVTGIPTDPATGAPTGNVRLTAPGSR